MKISVLFSTLILFSLSAFCQDQIIHKGSSLKSNDGFIENKGQVYDQNYLPNPAVKYLLSLGNGLNVQLKANSFSYDTYITERVKSDREKPPSKFMDSSEMYDIIYHFHRVDIELLNANPAPQIVAEGPSEDYLNYYNAVTPEEGATFVRSFQKITYQNIYPGIDLEFQAKPGTEKPVEYNFIIHPGGDASQIKLKYNGADETSLSEGKISVKVAHGSFNESIPQSQLKETNEKVQVKYILNGNNEFGFQIPQYNELLTLIIDPLPILDWGTYYGGSAGDNGAGIVNDINGNCYVTGTTYSNSAIATSGSYQSSKGWYGNAFIVKFNLSGQRLWGTYYGGDGGDVGSGISYSNNFIYITGNTGSTSGIATSGSYKTVHSGSYDVFIAKFNTSGQRQWGTYYGGIMEDRGNGIANDKSGNIFITGYTNSSSGIATIRSHKQYLGGSFDAFIVKFNLSGQRIWGTYYGGTEHDVGNGITTDGYGNCYVIGTTESNSGIATAGARQTIMSPGCNHSDPYDAFIVKFNWLGQRQWGTYYGDGRTEGSSIITDNSGNIFFKGNTVCGDTLIATPGSFQSVSGIGAFIAKFNSLGQRQWGTFFYDGGFGWSQVDNSITTDLVGNVLFTGYTGSTTNISTIGAHQIVFGGGDFDAFVVKFNTSGSRIWGTYYGGNRNDLGYGISTYMNYVFIIGSTTSSNSIATSGAHQTNISDTINGKGDAFIAKFISCYPSYDTIYASACDRYFFNGQYRYISGNYTDTFINYMDCDSLVTLHLNILGPKTQFSVNDSSQCLPGNLFSFSDSSTVDTGSISYHWYFGDNESSNLSSPSHSYNQSDTFSVKLITFSDFGCRDSLVKSVIVKPIPVADFEINDSIQCIGLNAFNFTNKSSPDKGKISYLWEFGDGDTSTLENPVHSFLSAGTFNVKLTFTSSLGCKDSVVKPVYVIITDTNLKADFEINDTTQCFNNQNFIITNKSNSGSGIFSNTWYFDQDTFTSTNLQFSNLSIGKHALKLITLTDHGCTDTTLKNLHVCPLPKAGFTIDDTAQCSIYNSFQFTNTSSISADTLYSLWDFGDGSNSTFAPHNYYYHSNGKFRIKLTVTSPYGCTDSVVKNVIVSPETKIIDVTNGYHCGPGQVLLKAEAVNGKISWYDSYYGGILLDTGNQYTTGMLSASKTFYAIATNEGCTTPINSIEAFIIEIPSIVSTYSPSMGGPGYVTLTAVPSEGRVAWYDLATGGNQLFVGNSYLTPYLYTTTTFYAEAQFEGCYSYPRTAVTATIPTGIAEKADQVFVILYPNPAHDMVILSIQGFMEPAKLQICDVRGRILKIIEIVPSGPDYIQKIDLQGFEQGVYHLILMNYAVYRTFKIVKF